MEKVLRREELAKLLGVSLSTINRWVKDGKFPKPIKLGYRVVVWLSCDVEAFLRKQKENK